MTTKEQEMDATQYTGGRVNYTGRYSVKCTMRTHEAHCAKRTIWNPQVEQRDTAFARLCGTRTEHAGRVTWYGASRKMGEVIGQHSDRKSCGSLCTGATGPACDCSCAGENHGRGA